MNNSGNNKGKKSPAKSSTHSPSLSHISATPAPSVAAPVDISISSGSPMDISSALSSVASSNTTPKPKVLPRRVKERERLVVNFKAGGHKSGAEQEVGDVEVCNSGPGVVSPVLSNGGEFNITIDPNQAKGNQKIGKAKFGNHG